MKRAVVGVAAWLILVAAPALAQDAEGCKDHPLFTRFPNMVLIGCDSSQFDMRGFPTGAPDKDGNTKAVEVEGPVVWLGYEIKEGTTPPSGLQIMRDFENAAGGLTVEVAGHTDNVGAPESNLRLSQERAQAVLAALVQRGVAAGRLTAKGYGQTTPIADNHTEDGRAKNRRVELVKKQSGNPQTRVPRADISRRRPNCSRLAH